jgi:hypothetical protein
VRKLHETFAVTLFVVGDCFGLLSQAFAWEMRASLLSLYVSLQLLISSAVVSDAFSSCVDTPVY